VIPVNSEAHRIPQENHTRQAGEAMTRECAVTEVPGQEDENADLRELGDPGFFTHWADIRNRLARTPKDDPEHGEIKRQYDAVAAEYRRRLSGATAS